MKVHLERNYVSLYNKVSYNVLVSQCIIIGEVYCKDDVWYWIGFNKAGKGNSKIEVVQQLIKIFGESYVG